MINELRESGRLRIIFLLGLMSLFSFSLSVFRFYVTDTPVFLFLNWNLFLAFIPWLAVTVLAMNARYSSSRILLFGVLIVWILFFPNSPYILTDLFHLRLKTSVPVWYDLVVILSFAWTGLTFGFVSLAEIEVLMSRYIKPARIRMAVVGLLFLSSFGVYLGRYLRWNSWDVLTDPQGLFSDIGDRFINPFSHPRTWGMTLLLGVLLNMMYLTMQTFSRRK